MRTRIRRRSRRLAVGLVVLLGVSGCSGDTADPEPSPDVGSTAATPGTDTTGTGTATAAEASTVPSPDPSPATSPVPAPDEPLAFVDALVPDDGAWAQPYGVDIGPDGTIFVLDAGKDRVVGFSPDGTQVVEFGGTGREDGQLDTLDFGALAIGPDGTVHVVDNGNSRIQSFTPDGEFVRAFGSEGDGDGQFRRAIGIATDTDGKIHVTDDARPVVQVFDAEGTFVRAFGQPGDGPGGLVHATGIDVDERGHVFVADFEAARVQEFDPEGQVVGEYRLPGAAGTNGTPEGVVALPDGRVWVTDYRGGAVVQLPAEPTGPDVDDLPDPALVAGDVGSGDGALQAPVDLAVAPDGTLVVTDQQAGTVQRFAPA